jgi:hypothetical protein
VTRHNIIRSAIEDLPILDVIDAHELADTIIDKVISALLRDPNNTRSRREWAFVLADTRARIVEQIHRRIYGHTLMDDVLNALVIEGVS